MSTANKLSYLNDTKSLLRTSLNKFGSSILSTDTFRSYDTKLNEIYDKLPKVTQSGAGLTITPVQNGQVDDFKMIGVDLVQSGTPTPDSPQEIKVVEGRQVITNSGKNLLNPYTEPTERYGITASYNQNTHVYTFNGTCTRDNITFILSNNKINFTKQVTKSITFWVGGSCTNSCDIRHFDSNYNSNVIYSIVNISSTNNKISKTSNYTFESPINYATIRFNNGSVANNLQIKVMVTDDDNTDYEPYYNPVSYNIDLQSENLCNGINQKYWLNTTVTTAGIADNNTGLAIDVRNLNIVEIETSVTQTRYRVACVNSLPQISSQVSVARGINKDNTSSSISINTTGYNYLIVNATDLTKINVYYKYELAKMPNTDYKNRIYKNNGNWYFEEKVKKIVIDEKTSTPSIDSSSNNTIRLLYSRLLSNNKSIADNPDIVSNYLTGKIMWSIDSEGIYSNNNDLVMRMNKSTVGNTLNSVLDWLSTHNVEIWYPLATPVTTQITNTTLINQLEAISVHTGTNIIELSSDNNMTPQIEITRLKELERLT